MTFDSEWSRAWEKHDKSVESHSISFLISSAGESVKQQKSFNSGRVMRHQFVLNISAGFN